MTAPTDIVNWNPIDGSPGPPDYSQGPKGDTGATGAPGPTGAKGDKGDPGIQGVQGVKGDKGDQGPIGPGGAGSVGPQGPPGADGPQGAPGQGIATGGATGQVLAKNSVTNYDTGWITPSTTPGGPAGGVLNGTYPNPSMAGGVAATNVGTLSGVLGGTLPSPTMAAGAAATNVGTLGGSLSGTLPNPTLAANSVGASQITDGTVGTAELANASVTNAKLAADTARANLLTNGGFEIWQRGNGPFTANGGYTADRWLLNLNGTDTMSVSKNTVSGGNPPSSWCATCAYTHGSGADSSLIQIIKNSDVSIQGVTFTLSARVSASVANSAFVRLASDGTGAINVTSAFAPGGSVWTTLSVTGTIPTNATFFNATLGCSLSGTFSFDNVTLVVGSVAADYAPLHPADDLARCLRYYEPVSATNGQYLGNGLAFSTTQALHVVNYKVQKAVTPTVTYTSPANYATTNGSGTQVSCTSISNSSLNQLGPLGIVVGVAAGLTVGQASLLQAINPGTGLIVLEANP